MTKSPAMRFLEFGAFFLLVCLGFGFHAAHAQSITDLPPDMVAPPRLSVAEGTVQFLRAGSDWTRAELNTALAVGDAIQTGDGGTIELQIGPRDFVRMTANSTLTLASHDAGLMQFRIDGGLASFDLRGTRSAQLVEIDTPNAAIVVGGNGYYRVYVREGETRVTVRQGGRATLNFPDGRARNIVAGEEVVVLGPDGQRVDQYPAPVTDNWDRWNDARSDYYASATSNRYVPTDVYGAADLDQYGNWRQSGAYGWVWVPAVASGWAPYSTGSWQWDPVFGWTWVDVAPWGWTTSHYGRWVNADGHWVWAPGPRTAHVAYAPALVSFYHHDGGTRWVALGWGEPIVPWWGRPGFRGSPWWGGWGGPRVEFSESYVHRNQGVQNAVIGVRDEDFGRHHVRGSSLPMSPGIDLRPVHGDHPIVFAPGRGPSVRPENREWTREREPHRETPPAAQPQRGPESQPQYRREVQLQPVPQQPQFRREAQPQPAPEIQHRREVQLQPAPEMQRRREVQVQPTPQPQPQLRRDPPPQSAPVQQQPRQEVRPEPRERREPERQRFESRPVPMPAPAIQVPPAVQPRVVAPPPAAEPRGGRERDQRDENRGRHDQRNRD